MHHSEKCLLIIFSSIVMSVIGKPSWEPPSPPECQSYNSLCDITVDVTDTNSSGADSDLPHSGTPMCQCPGNNTCPSQLNDKDRVLHLVMTSPGQIIKTKLKYCNPLKRDERQCRHGEVAVTLRGVGPIVLNIVGGVKCTCKEPLSLKKARPDGMYSLQYYACGKRECRVNDSNPPVCERIRKKTGGRGRDVAVVTRYPCECPSGYECSMENHLNAHSSQGVTEFTCRPKL